MRFQRLTVVRLVTSDPPAPDTPDDDRVQAEHLAYLDGLRQQGLVVLNGPIRSADSPEWRGLTVYRVDVGQARELANADPAVLAGWFDVVIDSWLLPAIPVTLGDTVDIEVT